MQTKLSAIEHELSQNELATASLTREIAELTATLDAKTNERRDAERESANSGAALRQMEAETARIERRLQEWQLAMGRNGDQRQARQDLIGRKREEAERFEAERAQIERQVSESNRSGSSWHACEPRGVAGCGLSRERCACVGSKSGAGTRPLN